MEVSLYFSMFFSFATEMIIAFLIIVPKRLNFRSLPALRIPLALLAVYGTSVGLFLLTRYVVPWSIGWNISIYTIFVAVIYFAIFAVYSFRWSEALLLTMIAYTIQSILYQLNVAILGTGLSDFIYSSFGEEGNLAAKWVNAIIQIALYCTAFVAIYFTFGRYYAKVYQYTLDSRFISFMAVGVYLVVVVSNAFASNYASFRYFYPLRGALACTYILVCVLFQLYVVYGFRASKAVEERKLVESTLSAKLDQYMKSEQNIAFINAKCHDLRKQIRALKTRKENLSDQDFALLEESLRFYDTGIRTGNHGLDTLIQEKQLYCRAHNIEFTTLLDGNALPEMAFSDAYFLFLNVIDNAIEAAEMVSDPEYRTISLTAQKARGLVYIECANYFEGERKFSSDGHLLSTKESPEGHGFGTRSIEYIVRKYKGKVTHEIEGNCFRLKIVF